MGMQRYVPIFIFSCSTLCLIKAERLQSSRPGLFPPRPASLCDLIWPDYYSEMRFLGFHRALSHCTNSTVQSQKLILARHVYFVMTHAELWKSLGQFRCLDYHSLCRTIKIVFEKSLNIFVVYKKKKDSTIKVRAANGQFKKLIFVPLLLKFRIHNNYQYTVINFENKKK